MPDNGNIPLARFRILERIGPTVPGIADVAGEVCQQLETLHLPAEKLREHQIAVGVGSRGVADLAIIVRAVCDWLKSQGAHPFIFPAMGSHGGATAEGQRKVLENYGVTPDSIGVELHATMDAVSLGATPEGFQVFMDRNAWSADGVVIINRVKPHTDFSGKIESGLLKMMAVGMGKAEGARECHRWSWKFGFETAIRAMSAKTLATGKILAGVALVENESHQIAAVRAAQAPGIVSTEEQALAMARPLVPRIPFAKMHLLIVNEMGKNISGTGMDTKVIGRGVELEPGEAPQIGLIYVRDITPESAGNALGVGLADLIHERLYRKIDLQKMYANARTSMNPPMPRVPIFWATDREALEWALGALGSPDAAEQRVVWIRNTLNLDRVAVSESLAREASALRGWRLVSESQPATFNGGSDLNSPI